MNPAKRSVVLLHPFDAYAGSQRIGATIVTILRNAGIATSVKLGFGCQGFMSELPGVKADIRSDDIPTRKLLYGAWALWAMFPVTFAAMRGRIIWATSVYALVPALLAVILIPRRVVVHLHEATFARPFHMLMRFAAYRGAKIVCVSKDQAQRLGVTAAIVPNSVESGPQQKHSRNDRLIFVGTTQPVKGFAFFVAVCTRLRAQNLRMAAYLSDEERHDIGLVARARAEGIDVFFRERSPHAIYADGFLVLICTDAAQCSETFSLVAAEAVTHLVPVAGTGITVLPEVLGQALYYNDPSRDPDRMAVEVAALVSNPKRHAALCAACDARRPIFSESNFRDRIVGLLDTVK